MKAIPKRNSDEIRKEKQVYYHAQMHLCSLLDHLEAIIDCYEQEGELVSHKEPNENGEYFYEDTTLNINKWDDESVAHYEGVKLAREVLRTAIEGQ